MGVKGSEPTDFSRSSVQSGERQAQASGKKKEKRRAAVHRGGRFWGVGGVWVGGGVKVGAGGKS